MLDRPALLRYQVRTTSGELVPLSSIATVTQTVQPNALTNFQQLSSATLSGVPFPGRTMGEVTAFMEGKAKELLPQGMTFDYQGESRQFVQEGNTLAIAFLIRNFPTGFGALAPAFRQVDEELDRAARVAGAGRWTAIKDVTLPLTKGALVKRRVGTVKALELMQKDRWDQPLLRELSQAMADASICGLGQAAPNPFDCVIRYFPHELEGA